MLSFYPLFKSRSRCIYISIFISFVIGIVILLYVSYEATISTYYPFTNQQISSTPTPTNLKLIHIKPRKFRVNHIKSISIDSSQLALIQKSKDKNSLNNIYRISKHNDSLNSMHEKIEKLGENKEYYILLNRMDDLLYFPHRSILTYSLKYGNILYHCMAMAAGLGNNLLSYWFSRGLAFFFNLKYKQIKQIFDNLNTSIFIKNVLKHYFNSYQCSIDNRRWTSTHKQRLEYFLPKTYNITFNEHIVESISNGLNEKDILNKLEKYTVIQQYLLQIMINIKKNSGNVDNYNFSKWDGDLLHEMDEIRIYGNELYSNINNPWLNAKWSIFYLNDIMREIMAVETKQAFNDMMVQNVITAKSLKKIKAMFTSQENKNDILIHIRCGDIIRKGVWYNGFQTMSFFKMAKEKIDEIYFIMNGRLNDDIKNTKVYVMMQLLDDNATYSNINMFRDNWFEDMIKCRIIANKIIDYMRNNTFADYKNVYLISNGTMHGDYYTIMNAPIVICGYSTFCHSASLCNLNANIIIWPTMWFQQFDFMPNGIFLVKNKWITSDQVKRKEMSAEELAHYLITH